MSPQQAATLLDGVSVLRDPALAEAAKALTDELFLDPSKDRIEEAFCRFFAAAGHASAAHRVRATVDPQLRARIEPVLRRLSEDEVTPRLDVLGALVGMSSYQVVRAVKRVTGLSPIAWRQNSRVLRARRLLGEGESIADAANLLGFTDQSHFHRVFRAHVAASPGAYRA
jgi:AraC-like DNA-binding protein